MLTFVLKGGKLKEKKGGELKEVEKEVQRNPNGSRRK